MAMFPLPITVELNINDTWTDVTSFVYLRDGIQITGGAQNEGATAQPATCTLTLNNRDGRFSPYYASGAYYPYLKRNVQLRVGLNNATSSSGNVYSGYRFWGEVAHWPPLSDISGRDVYVQVTASGPLRRLRQGGGKGSALTRYYGLLTGSFAPIAYWPCEEDPNTTVVGAGIDGGTNMNVTVGTPKWKAVSDFNGSAPIGILNNSTWDGLTGSFGASGDDVFTTPGTYTWVCPAGITSVNAKCWGGGGGGSFDTGVGNLPGANGGNSTFAGDSMTVITHGGSGAATGSGGAGGTGSTNTTHFPGGSGAAYGSTVNSSVWGGGGGGSGGTASAGNSVPNGTSSGAAAVTGGGPGGAGSSPSNHSGSQPASGPGGGGGGGGSVTGGTAGDGAGGGGGEFAQEATLAVTPGNSYTVVVGAGGSGATGAGSGAAGKVELSYTPTSVPAANIIRFIVFVPKHGGNPGKVLLQANTGSAAIGSVQVKYQSGGKLELIGYSGSGGTGSVVFDSGAMAWNADGQTLMVSIELTNSGSAVNWAFRAIQPGASATLTAASGTVATAAVGNVSEIIAAPNADITKTAMGHISLQYAYIDILKVSNALNGHHTEMSIDRFIRLANEQALGSIPQYAEKKDHWGFEDGTTQGWVATNGTLSLSSGWSSEGTTSLTLTANGAGQPSASTPTGTSGQPVSPGDIVSVAAQIRAPSTLSHLYLGIRWYQASGAACTHAEDDTADTVVNGGNDALFKVTATAPSGTSNTAAFFAVCFGDHNADANGTTMRIDDVRVTPRMGPQTRKEAHKFLQEVEELDRGILKEAKELWGLKYRTRISLINQSPAVILDYSQGMISPPLAPVIDDQKTANDITVHRHKGSKVRVTLDSGELSVQEPPAGAGRYRKNHKAVAEIDQQLLALATHLLNLGTVTGERYPTISVTLDRCSLPGNALAPLMSAIASVEIGDFLQLVSLPFFYPSTTAKQLVIGYTETLNMKPTGSQPAWTITWNCTPESPYELTATSIRRW